MESTASMRRANLSIVKEKELRLGVFGNVRNLEFFLLLCDL